VKALSCNPDLTLEIESFDDKGEHTPFWGGQKHQCRDREKVHDFLASRNMGFSVVDEGGMSVLKAFPWSLPH
jgi:hypothetical protein